MCDKNFSSTAVRHRAHQPISALTAHAMNADRASKPIRLQELDEILEGYVTGRTVGATAVETVG